MIPFHAPSVGEEEIAEVVDTLRSGWLTTGHRVQRFETEFAAAVGARHAVALNSATAALHLALEAIGLRSGDEVIIPTYTFAATGEVVAYFQARPVLVDCRADTLNVDAATIEPFITPRTKAIIPVHIAGQACDMDGIWALARQRRLKVVEDAAHALPTTYRGRLIGTGSDAVAFSFYATKTITTGEGGMVTVDDDALAARIRMMSLHGLSHDAWNRYAVGGSWHYDIVEFGFKYNLTDLAAGLGLHQLKRIHEFLARREQIAAMYRQAFGGLETCTVPEVASYGTHAWHLYILRLNLPALRVGRDDVIRALRERGIGTSVHFRPLHLHSVYQQRLGYRPGDFPVAEREYERAISLPIYPGMRDEDVAVVSSAVVDVLTAFRK
jgi:perosamine synthetase